jgi:hypothetical protein
VIFINNPAFNSKKMCTLNFTPKPIMLMVRNWYADDPRCVQIVDGAMAAQRRCTPARAAWMAACV